MNKFEPVNNSFEMDDELRGALSVLGMEGCDMPTVVERASKREIDLSRLKIGDTRKEQILDSLQKKATEQRILYVALAHTLTCLVRLSS